MKCSFLHLADQAEQYLTICRHIHTYHADTLPHVNACRVCASKRQQTLVCTQYGVYIHNFQTALLNLRCPAIYTVGSQSSLDHLDPGGSS